MSRTRLFLALGLALRAFHYLRDPSVWHDEASVLLNLLNKDFAALLGPLAYGANGPPLFLWLERVALLVSGDSSLALRLPAFLASCAALFLVVYAARHFLEPRAVPWAVLFAAVSDSLLWHTCEAKPYSTDVLVTALLFAAAAATHDWPLSQRLLLAAATAPVVLALSFPACFVLGGLGMTALPAVWRERRGGPWLAYALFGLAVSTTLLGVVVPTVHAQRRGMLVECWQDMWPDRTRPLLLPGWVTMRLLESLRYAYEPVGNVLVFLAVVGAATLWRGGRRGLVLLALAPLALNAVAALLHQYPLGPFRVVAYAAPGLFLLLAAGLVPTLDWLRRRGRLGPALLLGVVLFPVGRAAYRLAEPWGRADAAAASAYVQERGHGELVVGNAWEHAYYFRGQGDRFQPLETLDQIDTDHCWFLCTGATPELRRTLLEGVRSHGLRHVLEAREFQRLTVYRLARTPGDAAR